MPQVMIAAEFVEGKAEQVLKRYAEEGLAPAVTLRLTGHDTTKCPTLSSQMPCLVASLQRLHSCTGASSALPM
jgi:hypothetical protein